MFTRSEANQLLARAHGGDKTVLPVLRRLLNESPGLWNELGNIAMQARRSWIELAAGNDEVMKEALWRQLSDRTLDLSGPAPSPLERLVIGRVVMCWLQLHYWDLLAAQSNESTLRQREYLQRSQERAQRQYLSAIRTLATVRRLQLPAAVQVNIGGQHVNVLDPGATPESRDRQSTGAFTGPLSPTSSR
jgi:hypothetical protein